MEIVEYTPLGKGEEIQITAFNQNKQKYAGVELFIFEYKDILDSQPINRNGLSIDGSLLYLKNDEYLYNVPYNTTMTLLKNGDRIKKKGFKKGNKFQFRGLEIGNYVLRVFNEQYGLAEIPFFLSSDYNLGEVVCKDSILHAPEAKKKTDKIYNASINWSFIEEGDNR